jgi:hypothetical protein
MKYLLWRLVLIAGFAWLVLFGGTSASLAAEEERRGLGERIENMERRIEELAQRQEQMMQRLGAAPEGQRPMAQPRPERFRRPLPFGEPPGPGVAKVIEDVGGLVKLVFLVGIIFNILLAVWIYTDIRKRGEGSGIFVALALLGGIPTAIIYAIVRLGDKKT